MHADQEKDRDIMDMVEHVRPRLRPATRSHSLGALRNREARSKNVS